MKALLIVVGLFTAAVLQAQTTPTEASMSAQIDRQLRQLPPGHELLAPQLVKANEIKTGTVTYSGIFVEFTKVDQPWQLINPAAPAEYGSSEDNTVIDPITGRGSGLKLFSLGF